MLWASDFILHLVELYFGCALYSTLPTSLREPRPVVPIAGDEFDGCLFNDPEAEAAAAPDQFLRKIALNELPKP